MRKLKCPQCRISNLYVKNNDGERRLIFVMEDFTVIPAKEGETLEGFNLETIYCLGCSWKGTPRKVVRH